MKKIYFSYAENMRICNFIISEYRKSGLDDVAFAKLTNEKLSLHQEISAHHIRFRRDDLGISGNKPRYTKEAVTADSNAVALLGSLVERVTVLENRLKLLEKAPE